MRSPSLILAVSNWERRTFAINQNLTYSSLKNDHPLRLWSGFISSLASNYVTEEEQHVPTLDQNTYNDRFNAMETMHFFNRCEANSRAAANRLSFL